MDCDFAHDLADVSTIEMLHFECFECIANAKLIGGRDENFTFNDNLL